MASWMPCADPGMSERNVTGTRHRRFRRGSLSLQYYIQISPSPVTTIFPLGRKAMSNGQRFKSESPTKPNLSSGG